MRREREQRDVRSQVDAAGPFTLNFFARSRFLERLETSGPSGAFWIVLFLISFPAVAASAVSSRFGGPTAVRDALTDVGQAFGNVVLGRTPKKDTSETYPLLRDTPSIVLAAVMAATAGLVLLQWARFRNALREGAELGTLRGRDRSELPGGLSPCRTWKERLRGEHPLRALDLAKRPWRQSFLTWIRSWTLRERDLDQLRTASGVAASDSDMLAALIQITNTRLSGYHKRRWIRAWPWAASLALSTAIEFAHRQAGLFKIIAPDGQTAWAETTLDQWWATHPLGRVAYFLIALVGIYLVIIQNVGGFQAVRVIASLPDVADLDVDWLNTDGHYGWDALRSAYETVVLSLTLHAFALSLLIFVVGFKAPTLLLVPLVVLWIIAALAYILIPRWSLQRVYSFRAESKVLELRAEALRVGAAQEPLKRIETETHFRRAIEDVHACRFTPLIGRSLDRKLLVFSVLLPVILTTIQVLPSI